MLHCRQRSVTSSGYAPADVGNGAYRVDGAGPAASPSYDYGAYGSRAQQSAAQRRVNSEGELLAYHRGDEAAHPGMSVSYPMPMTGGHLTNAHG